MSHHDENIKLNSIEFLVTLVIGVLHFRPEEFETYKIGENTTITFCMRELRAILNFAESMNINISANFDTAGKYERLMHPIRKLTVSNFTRSFCLWQAHCFCDKRL